ncbi:MAG: hypothetical protein JO093_13915 [Acidobacteria bacterium]|nr:hypothetical protein [Acidobacteriota bacterium]MBV9186711.1 hypothetical protein [Acidobacteriota bacterium]
MRERHREIIGYEASWRLEALLRRLASVTGAYPWLAPGVTHTQVRRTIKRLRSGAMQSPEPDIPSPVLADLLEGAIAQDTLIREARADMISLWELIATLKRRAR